MTVKRKTRTGKVVSNKMDKTVVVSVENLVRHPLYKKVVRRVTRFKAHDENNVCKLGDIIKIVESRPLSRDKRWRVSEIVRTKNVAEVLPNEIAEPEIEEK